MLVFKDIKNEDELLDYLSENGLGLLEFNNGIFFGGYEDDKLFGIAEAYLKNDRVFLGVNHIVEDHSGQGMEEAILRSLFNKLELNNIDFIYCDTKSALLDKIGFEERSEGYLLDLKKLFDSGCSCCGGEAHEE